MKKSAKWADAIAWLAFARVKESSTFDRLITTVSACYLVLVNGDKKTNPMRSVNDVEAYLGKMNRRYSPVDDQPGTFLVHGGDNMPPTALRVDPPLVVLRVHVGDVDGTADSNGELFKKLLMLNAKALVHTSFGLEESRIILASALELENLDYNELEATLDEIDMTLSQQIPTLVELSKHVASVRPSSASDKGKA